MNNTKQEIQNIVNTNPIFVKATENLYKKAKENGVEIITKEMITKECYKSFDYFWALTLEMSDKDTLRGKKAFEIIGRRVYDRFRNEEEV